MRTLTNHYWFAVLMLSVIVVFNAQSQTIASYDFESGLQGWTDGGSDSGLNTITIYVHPLVTLTVKR